MKDYVKTNKEAWEEAFELRREGWGEDIVRRVTEEELPFFDSSMADALKKHDLRGKTIGQFCCNNGRELISLFKYSGAAHGVGFDIAENQIAFAKATAEKLGLDCAFVATDILALGSEYDEAFDMAMITIGALCWFEELDEFFSIVSHTLKPGGVLLINEQHPFTNMLPQEEDEGYDPEHRAECVFSYFEHKWVSESGMFYMTGRDYRSKPFTDFTHPLSDIIGGICANNMALVGFCEYDRDISFSWKDIEGRGLPPSMTLEARKMAT